MSTTSNAPEATPDSSLLVDESAVLRRVGSPAEAAGAGGPAGVDTIGLVDGSSDTDSRTVNVVLTDDAMVQLDDMVAIATTLPDGTRVTHYGIVTELRCRLEGVELPSDTARFAGRKLPAEKVRRAEVRLLRTLPEFFVAPDSGSQVVRATGEHRARALFEDEMTAKLPIGLDLTGQPVYADMRFVDGRAGGHVSISGVSGVATKTSYALFLLYQLLETEAGIDLLGGPAGRAATRALVFNTKGEDLLHIDRPNILFPDKPNAPGAWRRLGVDSPGPFTSVRLYAPRSDTATGTTVADVLSRDVTGISAYGWTPEQFVREQLLQFCFTEEDQRSTQVGFAEQQVRVQLLRRLRRLAGDRSGAIVIADVPDANETYNADRIAARTPAEVAAGTGTVVRDYGDLVDLLERIIDIDDEHLQREWFGGTTLGTRQAFLRRLVKLRRRIGPLVSCGVSPVDLAQKRVHVVDISRLHDDAQRFVVGALLDRIWREKQGTGRLPLRFVLLDELNKYAPASGFSPLKDLLVDIAERGRSLGVLLIGAQQAASAVAPALPRNASLKVAGRLDASESEAYRFLTPGLRERAPRFMPGTMVVSQPIGPEPIPIRFPWPPYATNPDDAAPDERTAEEADRIGQRLDAFAGPEVQL